MSGIRPAEYWARAAEYASDQDRTWFAAHPDASEYYRRIIPGEFGADSDHASTIRVRVVKHPWGRVRHTPGGVPDTDPAAIELRDDTPELPAAWVKPLLGRIANED
jgi:hypothetical protein